MRQRVAIGWLIAGFLVLVPKHVLALEPKWPEGDYKYIVIDQDLRSIITEFGRNTQLAVKMSADVPASRIRGKLPVTSAKDFLEALCERYGLNWYFDGAALHFSTWNEAQAELIDLGRLSPSTVQRRLKELGIANDRYTVKGTNDGKILSVAGPPAYRNIVRQTIAALKKPVATPVVREVAAQDKVEVRVFRGNR